MIFGLLNLMVKDDVGWVHHLRLLRQINGKKKAS